LNVSPHCSTLVFGLVGIMAAMVAGSPMSAHVCNFKSPLRSVRADTCGAVASEEVYADAHARTAQWRKDFLSSASYEAQQGLRELGSEREHLKDLRADLASVQSLVQVASQLKAGGGRLAEVLHASSHGSVTRAQTLDRMKSNLRKSSERCELELKQEEHLIEQQQVLSEAQHSEALKLLAVYEGRLGLAITREASQTVRMAFSLLDAADPAREFYFTLGLSGAEDEAAESYRVHECSPHVPDLAQLLSELNRDACSSTSLPRFVCSMRRAFLKLVGDGLRC